MTTATPGHWTRDPAPGKRHAPQKNRAGGFFWKEGETSPGNSPRSRQPRRGNPPCSYKTASGRSEANITAYIGRTGKIAASYEYDPFGNILRQSGKKAKNFAHRFSTKPQDPQTGLLYYGYRHYSPESGRWLSRDPIEEDGGLNLYAFVDNSSTHLIDVAGLLSYSGARAAVTRSFRSLRDRFKDGIDQFSSSLADKVKSYAEDVASEIWDLKRSVNQQKRVERRLIKNHVIEVKWISKIKLEGSFQAPNRGEITISAGGNLSVKSGKPVIWGAKLVGRGGVSLNGSVNFCFDSNGNPIFENWDVTSSFGLEAGLRWETPWSRWLAGWGRDGRVFLEATGGYKWKRKILPELGALEGSPTFRARLVHDSRKRRRPHSVDRTVIFQIGNSDLD